MTTATTAAPMTSQEIIDLTKKHTLFEWSAQSKVDPIPVARAKGIYFYTPDTSASSTSTPSSCPSTSDTAMSA